MKLRYCEVSRKWQAAYPQCGSPSGWSDWVTIPRERALVHIEQGFEFNRDYS